MNKQITSNISSSYYQVEVIDVNGGSVKSATRGINFYYPIYYGTISHIVEIDTINKNTIASLQNKVIDGKTNQTLTYTTSNERMVIAYPSSYGQLASILDPNGFEQINSFETTTVTLDNQQNYRVYMNNANTNTNFKLTFKF